MEAYIRLKAKSVELSAASSRSPSHDEELQFNATEIADLLEGAREELQLDI